MQQAAFAEPGGERLREWIEACPNQLYSALTFQGGAAWRRRLADDLGDQGAVSQLIDKRSNEELAALMGNLGGHDLPSLLEAFEAAERHNRPVCFIAYTIKGFGLPLAGHKDNHAGLMTAAQVDALRRMMNIREGHEWDRFEALADEADAIEQFLKAVPFVEQGPRRYRAEAVPVPEVLRAAHRHHLARRHRLDQSRRLGEPARAVRARGNGRSLQEGAHSFDL
jgi:pyruvate dehydrogenase E1 component